MEQKQAIISKINRSKKGTIFLPDSFMPIDTRHAANVLAELAKAGKLESGIRYLRKTCNVEFWAGDADAI